MNRIKRSSTCIVILKNTKNKLVMAADRRASYDWSKMVTMNKPKIRKVGQYLLGGTGDCSLCSLIVDAFEPPEYDFETSLDMFMHHKFYNAVKKLLLGKDYADEHRLLKIPYDFGVEIVIGIKGHLYSMNIYNPDDHKEHPSGIISLDECPVPYTTGCGGEHAKGAIDALILNKIRDSRLIATQAIKIAGINSPGCDGNVDIIVEG